MNNNIIVHKRFRNFISVLYGISYFFLAVFSIAGLALIGAGIAVPFVPVDLINSWLIDAPIEATYESNGITVQITQEMLDSVSITKTSLFMLVAATMLVVLNFTGITYFINRWLKNMKNADIFTVQNSKMIEYAAYGFIILTFLQAVMGMTVQHFIYESLNISDLVVDIFSNIPGNMYNFDLNIVTLFSGIFIWIIAKVFKYGAFLQDEYDQTI